MKFALTFAARVRREREPFVGVSPNCLIVRLCASPPTIFHGRGGALHPGGDSHYE